VCVIHDRFLQFTTKMNLKKKTKQNQWRKQNEKQKTDDRKKRKEKTTKMQENQKKRKNGTKKNDEKASESQDSVIGKQQSHKKIDAWVYSQLNYSEQIMLNITYCWCVRIRERNAIERDVYFFTDINEIEPKRRNNWKINKIEQQSARDTTRHKCRHINNRWIYDVMSLEMKSNRIETDPNDVKMALKPICHVTKLSNYQMWWGSPSSPPKGNEIKWTNELFCAFNEKQNCTFRKIVGEKAAAAKINSFAAQNGAINRHNHVGFGNILESFFCCFFFIQFSFHLVKTHPSNQLYNKGRAVSLAKINPRRVII